MKPKKRKKHKAKVIRLPERPPTAVVIIARAGMPIFKGATVEAFGDYATLTRAQIEHSLLPAALKRPSVVRAWMDGDELKVEMKLTPEEARKIQTTEGEVSVSRASSCASRSS